MLILVVNVHLRLYRRLLRAHKFLPHEMRSLGDDYLKAGCFLLVPHNRCSLHNIQSSGGIEKRQIQYT